MPNWFGTAQHLKHHRGGGIFSFTKKEDYKQREMSLAVSGGEDEEREAFSILLFIWPVQTAVTQEAV